jgi:hypothetical protein
LGVQHEHGEARVGPVLPPDVLSRFVGARLTGGAVIVGHDGDTVCAGVDLRVDDGDSLSACSATSGFSLPTPNRRRSLLLDQAGSPGTAGAGLRLVPHVFRGGRRSAGGRPRRPAIILCMANTTHVYQRVTADRSETVTIMAYLADSSDEKDEIRRIVEADGVVTEDAIAYFDFGGRQWLEDQRTTYLADGFQAAES